MRKKLTLFILFLVVTVTVSAQSESQAKLLKEAYQSRSTELLYKFFDNWSEEVKSNEKKAKNPYVKEAHKVFTAFYQPMQTIRRGTRCSIYDDKPYFIVQGSLGKICTADFILYKPEEIDSFMIARILPFYADDTNYQKKWLANLQPGYWSYLTFNYAGRNGHGGYSLSEFNIPVSEVVSDIRFRPPVSFIDKKVVYLTDGYKKLLDSFLGDDHVELGDENIMQPATASDISKQKKEFLDSAARIFYGHWGGYWQYETYPEASQIIFNPEMNRAVVLFRFVYEGGQAVLEKQDGEWKVVDVRFTWIE
ncbi:MAG: hypothetical protein J5741_08320 [Bacteroidales bacterium]|nr:hypothetical protein [Bacteroidales bacterium]